MWTDPHFDGVLPAGTPIAQCFPVSRESLELAFEPLTRSAQQRYDETGAALLAKPGLYRRRFRARRRRSSTGE
jgi:hypothetical protein